MPYAVIKVVNGNFAIAAECSTLKQAMVNFDNLCAALWNDDATLLAKVRVIDQSLNTVDGAEQTITHDAPLPNEQEAGEA